MISKARLCLLVCLLIAVATRTFAEVRNFQLSQVAGQWRCTASTQDRAAEQGRVVVVLLAPAGTSLTEWVLVYTAKDGSNGSEKFSGGPLQAAVSVTELKPQSTLAAKGKAAGSDVPCAEFQAAENAVPGSATTTQADTSRDQQARVWFASAPGKTAVEDLTKDLEARLGLKHIDVLPHLPSGALASPYPASAPETDDLQIALIIDTNEGKLRVPRVTTVACPERDGFRILGSLTELIGKGQAGVAPQPPNFVLLPIGQILQCGAGDVKYTMEMSIDGKPSGDPIQAQLKLRPIYQLAATATWGFDTANIPSYSAIDGKVARSTSRRGSQFYVGFIWYPRGIDYDRVTKRNLFSPFLFLDPAALKDHFIVGAALTAKGRISIPIGLSAHKVPVLKGVQLGAPFDGKGNVPTATDWKSESVGFFLGVAFNVAEFARVKNAVAAPGK